MNRSLLLMCIAVTLSGCAVVAPHDYPYGAYSDYPYGHPYAIAPAAPSYVVPAPVYGYGPPVYVGPPVRFSFGLNYRSEGWRHHGHRHRHFHGHGGFRGGWHGGRWRR